MKTVRELAEMAAGVLRRRGYTVIDLSWHSDEKSETALWQVQFQNSPIEKLTHTEIVKKANRK